MWAQVYFLLAERKRIIFEDISVKVTTNIREETLVIYHR